MGDTVIEPVTSSVSGKRATAAPAARDTRPKPRTAVFSSRLESKFPSASSAPREVETGFEPVCTDLQSVASPLGHSTGRSRSFKSILETFSERTTGFEPATLTLAR